MVCEIIFPRLQIDCAIAFARIYQTSSNKKQVRRQSSVTGGKIFGGGTDKFYRHHR